MHPVKLRLIIAALALLATAVLGFGFSSSQAPAVGSLPETLLSLPDGATFIGYVSVERLIKSPLFETLINEHGKDLDELAELIGLDARRDVREVAFFTVMEGSNVRKGAAVFAGSFDRSKIVALLQDQLFETLSHAGAEIFVAAGKDEENSRAVTFLTDQLAAVGDLGGVRLVVDTHKRTHSSVASSSEMLDLVGKARPGDSFWVAGSLESLLPQALVTLSPNLKLPIPRIRQILVSGNVQENISAMVRGETPDAQTATDVENLLRGVVALARLQSDLNPEIQKILESVQIASDQTAVTISLNVPFSLISLGLNLGH